MRRAVYAVLAAGLFLLLLSALVVTPEPPEVCAEPSPVDFQAAFRPLMSALLPEAAADAPASSTGRMAAAILPLLMAGLIGVPGARDANGRVLTAARYENSVYQLFRPEVAGG